MTTTAPPRPQRDSTPSEVGRRPRRRIDLSATQLVATAFAAITATVAGSYLGVTGTVIGAALASVLTAIGNAVYGITLRSTRDRVRAVVPVRRTAAAAQRTGGTRHRPRPGPGPVDEPPVLPAPAPRPHRDPSPADVAARTWRRVALSSIAVFAAVIALVTGVEVVAGRPLADVLRGDSGSGTSLFGGNTGPPRTTPAPVPTVTRTVIPKIALVTPTVTMTVPAATATKTSAPSATVTVSPSASTPASSAASASPTASTSGSGTTPAVP